MPKRVTQNDEEEAPAAKKAKSTRSESTCDRCGAKLNIDMRYHRRNQCTKTIAKCTYSGVGEKFVEREGGLYRCPYCPNLKGWVKVGDIQKHVKACSSARTTASASTSITPPDLFDAEPPLPTLHMDTNIAAPSEQTTLEKANKALMEDKVSSELAIPSDQVIVHDVHTNSPTPQISVVDAISFSAPRSNAPDTCVGRAKTSRNELEALVQPGGTSVVNDPLLSGTPYIINTEFNTLICIECKRSVDPRKSFEHIRKHHLQCHTVSSDISGRLETVFPGLTNGRIHPGRIVSPIFGLGISLEKYFVCKRCFHGYSTPGSFQNHHCSGDTSLESGFFSSHVQTFYHGSRCSYFPVVTPCHLHSKSGSDYNAFLKQRKAAPTIEPQIVEADDYRQLHAFLRKEGWISHLVNHPSSEICDLVSSPALNDSMQAVPGHVFSLMARLQSMISRAGFHVRRLLGTRPSDNHNSSRTISHDSVETDTLKRYSGIVSCLVAFVLRCKIGWDSDYQMPLTHEQQTACDLLLEHLKQLPLSSSDDRDCREDPDMIVDCFDDDIDEDYDPDPLDDVLAEDATSEVASVTQNDGEEHILNLLISLYTHLPLGKDNDHFYSPILRFIILRSHQRTGEWLPARKITVLFSIMLFSGRQVMFALMQQRVNKEVGMRYTEAYNLISKYLDDQFEGPIPSLYLLKRPLNRFASVELSPFVFTSVDFSGTNIVVLGRVLYLQDIKFFVETLIAELTLTLQDELLFGLSHIVDVTTWKPGVVYEEPRNTRIGYSCFVDPHNAFSACSDTLLKAVLDHPSVSGLYHVRDASNNIVWKAAPCLAYIDRCHAFEMMLFAATHMTLGEPPRGTEIASHLIRNISAGTTRNVLVMFQYLMLMGTFNKNSHVSTQHDAIMRVPLPEIGRLWMIYLTFVRPLLAIWQHHFQGQRAASRAFNNLFFGARRPLTSRQLSQALSYHTSRLLKIPITIGLWRHIVTWFLNHHAVKFQEHLSLSNKIALASQMGHSEFVHNQYAGDAAIPSGIEFHKFFQTIKTSGVWHELLGFEPQLTKAMNGTLIGTRSRGITPSLTSTNQGSIGNTSTVAEEVKALLLPDLIRLNSLTRANDLASLVQAMGIEQSPEAKLPGPHVVIDHSNPLRLRDLRKFLCDQSATFKTPQQAEAVEVLASNSPSVLIVGPTGSGKTLPVMLNAACYDMGRTTLLILPLLAMHDEYKARAEMFGMSLETWKYRSSPHHPPQIVLVAIENCVWDTLFIYVLTLLQKGRLSRIVVDEAHLLEKHEAFRPCVNFLKVFGPLPVSIILLTATCPQALERVLFKKVGRDVYRVLRQRTDRPEISQNMISIQLEGKENLEDIVAGKILNLEKRLLHNERMLLFCHSRTDCDYMAGLLGWKPYHSAVSVDDRSSFMKMWKDGIIKGLACTSMLNCCLDYPSVRYVLHLGAPRDAVDYYQAIGRCARDGGQGISIVYYTPRFGRSKMDEDPFGQLVIREMLYGKYSKICRRVAPSTFLDGTSVPCTMLRAANLCDICSTTISSDGSPSVTISGQESSSVSSSCSFPEVLSPFNHPAPEASFGTLVVSALASTQPTPLSEEQELGIKIRRACDALVNCCVRCWVFKKECTSHRLLDCEHLGPWKKSSDSTGPAWVDWLTLPVGCCYYCGCPQKMKYINLAHEKVRVHEHPSDDLCHWTDIFIPLAYMVYHDDNLQYLLPNINVAQAQNEEYANWLCQKDGSSGVINLVKLLVHVCDTIPVPSLSF